MEDIGKYTSGLRYDDLGMSKFTLQAAARELSENTALKSCLRAVIPNATDVQILKRPRDGRVYYAHLCTCKLVWLCPICAARISMRRTAELLEILTESTDLKETGPGGATYILRKLKYSMGMLTFTVGHKLADPLARTMTTLKKAYHRTFSGRPANRFYHAYDMVGSVRAFEITYGRANGWHPHIHTLLISNQTLTASDVLDINALFKMRWVEEVEFQGGYVTADRGVTFRAGETELIKYIDDADQHISKVKLEKEIVYEVGLTPAKEGHEMGRTLWQLLADYVRGDSQAGALWIAAQAELRGTKQLLASNAIKALLADPDALSDEIAGIETVETTDILLASLTLDEWRLVARWGLRGQLLDIARHGERGDIDHFLKSLSTLHNGQLYIPS